jgi:hypothetical protein
MPGIYMLHGFGYGYGYGYGIWDMGYHMPGAALRAASYQLPGRTRSTQEHHVLRTRTATAPRGEGKCKNKGRMQLPKPLALRASRLGFEAVRSLERNPAPVLLRVAAHLVSQPGDRPRSWSLVTRCLHKVFHAYDLRVPPTPPAPAQQTAPGHPSRLPNSNSKSAAPFVEYARGA